MAVNGVVRAAGGVVVRSRPDGAFEVAVVHRPAYDDWTLPKGKLQAGEREEHTALREVEEETGMRSRLDQV
jgi:8-oxo-dGTP pyrophosphatase MutT (NUDIX family)